MKDIDIVIPTFHCEQMVLALIGSFEKFNDGFNFRYIVVENSDDVSYKNKVENLKNVLWIQNPTNLVGSQANALANEVGLQHVNSDDVVLCHVDVAACHPDWMRFFYSKIEAGFKLVGIRKDTTRVHALHSSFLLTKTEIAKAVTMFPIYNEKKECVADVTDMVTVYCDKFGFPHFLCNNTFNDPSLDGKLNRFNGIVMDRAVNDKNEVIFIHVGRGIAKLFGTKAKPGRLTHSQWIEMCDGIIAGRI